MTLGSDLARLFQSDLTRLLQQVEAFPDDASLWQKVGTLNTAGNLALHLEGNLREYIGRQLGDVPYQRVRPQEFNSTGLSRTGLIARLTELRDLVPRVLAGLPAERWLETYPENVMGMPLSVQMFVLHLHSHFNYHLGQIDALRRTITNGEAIQYATLA